MFWSNVLQIEKDDSAKTSQAGTDSSQGEEGEEDEEEEEGAGQSKGGAENHSSIMEDFLSGASLQVIEKDGEDTGSLHFHS